MNKMRPKHRQKPKKGQLPILIRYRAQDYTTRYLDDPRIMYIEEFHDLHRDDGFVAMIPSERATRYVGNTWMALGWIAIAIASYGWLAYEIFSIL